MRIVATLLLLLLTIPASASSLLVLGDSLSAAYNMPAERGWVSLLSERLASEGYDVEVTNASVSGDTTQNGIARLSSLLSEDQYQLVVIELGGNDGLRGVPPFAIKQNLRRLVNMAQDHEAEVLLLGIRLPSNYGAAYNKQFTAIYQDVADDEDVPLVPFFMQNVALNRSLLQDDGIHPNAEGQSYLLDNVWPYLEELLN